MESRKFWEFPSVVLLLFDGVLALAGGTTFR